MTATSFGELIASRRAELRLTLRKLAERAEIDAGNLSRIERGHAAPPQGEDVLARLADALQLAPGTPDRELLTDLAMTANARIPADLMSDADVMAKMPLLFRTLRGTPLTDEKLERIAEAIRRS
jgi:transcriptional regulator with XRE-family HTH domain